MDNISCVCAEMREDRGEAVAVHEERSKRNGLGLYCALRYVPVVLYSVFSVMLFAFFFLPIAYFNSTNSGLAHDGIGNVYTAIYGMLRDDPVIYNSVITLFVVAILAFAIMIMAVVVCARGKFGKRREDDQIGATFAGNVSSLFYAVYIMCFTLAFVILGRILYLDGGHGVLSVQSFPVVMAAVDVLFVAVSAVTVAIRYCCEKKRNALIGDEQACL